MSHPYDERKESYLNLLEFYEEVYGELPRGVSFNLDDRGSRLWPGVREHSMCYRRDEPERKPFAGPDWTFWHWPSSGVASSAEVFGQIMSAGELPPLSDKVAWFGNIRSAGSLLPESVTRPRLVEFFGREHADRFEFFHSGFGAYGSEMYVSMPDMVRRYRYLLDIGGAGYSGRLKFLLFSGRPLFLVDRLYVEYFHDELEPFVHFIPVSSDLSDLLDMHSWVVENGSKAESIAMNARSYAFRRISLLDAVERMREVFGNISDYGAGGTI